MPPIPRGTGTTDSERYLSRLATRTFLDLWSYSNTFIDKKGHATGDGKELCDLLVVFGNDILIFSDKEIAWPEHDSIQVCWSRWYKRAIQKSVDQVLGAARWIQNHPDRIYLDSSCEIGFPLDLPTGANVNMHLICIAVGAEDAAKRHLNTHGSFALDTSIEGREHILGTTSVQPFVCGDVNPTGDFIHVFDRIGLDLVMKELDTVSDFCRYLRERKDFFRKTVSLRCSDERDLLGYYLTTEDKYGRHSFGVEALGPETSVLVAPGTYDSLIKRPEYSAKIEENKISYIWDKLILKFTETVLQDTFISRPEERLSVQAVETGLRILAAEDRTSRRANAISFDGVVRLQIESGQDRVTRIVQPLNKFQDLQTAYLFLLFKFPKDIKPILSDEQYRSARANFLEAYSYVVLLEYKNTIDRIVGIAMNGPEGAGPGGSHSEDLLVLEVEEWTDELVQEVKTRQKQLKIFDKSRLKFSGVAVQEYPSTEDSAPFTRQQRRQHERNKTKRRKR